MMSEKEIAKCQKQWEQETIEFICRYIKLSAHEHNQDKALESFIDHENWLVREAVAETAGLVKRYDLLERLVFDENECVRIAAIAPFIEAINYKTCFND